MGRRLQAQRSLHCFGLCDVMPDVRGEAPTALVSAIVPTGGRPDILFRTLMSLRTQRVSPAELIVVDASDDDQTQEVLKVFARQEDLSTRIIWETAKTRGAAVQRNQGVARATQPVIWFFDDDILFEPECVARLWAALQSDAGLGGVNAMITNQRYQPPGRISRFVFRLMAGQQKVSYAGQVLGPAVNLLPEDGDDLPEVVPVQWLNTTCTMYRREALPGPPFPSKFSGYSLMEDLALSLTVGRHWKLANARTARIYHDSRSGEYKRDVAAVSKMELVNRHHVMTEVMGRRSPRDYARLALWQSFQLAICALQERGGVRFWQELRGKVLGIFNILKRG
jgi:glycosyltransferase involved in cell wall biosynthesis